jgi:hypothetical protein
VPPSSVNCLDGAVFFPRVPVAGAIRVPRPAAGIITTTFIAACKYKGRARRVQISAICGSVLFKTPPDEPRWRREFLVGATERSLLLSYSIHRKRILHA